MATYAVREVLERDNYQLWSPLMENYLKAKELWSMIERPEDPPQPSEGDIYNAWVVNNAAALHAIQYNCGRELLSQIGGIGSAKQAWNELATLLGRSPRADIEAGAAEMIFFPDDSYHKLAKQGNWREASKLIDQHDPKLYDIHWGQTTLQISIIYGNEKHAEKLINRMPLNLLEHRDDEGYTALAHAAAIGTTVKLARSMVSNRRSLLSIQTNDDSIPVLLASSNGHKDMTRYLYNETLLTSRNVLAESNGRIGMLLFVHCLKSEIFDVALQMLQERPPIFQIQDVAREYHIFELLARMPYAFRSGTRLGFCTQLIYSMIPVDNGLRGYGQQKSKLAGFLEFFGLKNIYDQKFTHVRGSQLLKYASEKIKNFDEQTLRQAFVYEAMLEGAKSGSLEFLKLMIESRPELATVIDENKRGILAYAILHRQVKVFNFMCEPNGRRGLTTTPTDVYGNNFMHLAAKLGSSPEHDRKSCAVLEMQKELQWLEAGKRIVHPKCMEASNRNGKKPRQLFVDEHEKLMKDGEKWSKDSATSFSVIAILMITIMFPALLTLPGGNDQEKGFPIFVHKKNFTLYIISDLTSLVLAFLSLLTFSAIYTIHHTEIKFLKTLPRMFIIGLSTLYLSAATMMVTAFAAVSLILSGHPHIVKLAISLLSFPALLFVPFQFHLFVDIFNSTYRSEILSTRKMKGLNSKYH